MVLVRYLTAGLVWYWIGTLTVGLVWYWLCALTVGLVWYWLGALTVVKRDVLTALSSFQQTLCPSAGLGGRFFYILEGILVLNCRSQKSFAKGTGHRVNVLKIEVQAL